MNWKVINYVMDRLPFDYYDKPMHGCGTWAPSIRYHEGVYYVFVPMPDEGIMMCKTTDPWGTWSEPAYVRKVVGWIDPCPFWDEDGRAYMVSAFARSRIGFKSMLYMSPIEPDCSGVLDDGRFIYDGHATQPTIEGPKLYKRNGWYYIFAPAGGVKPGWQTVLRSRNIYGPYEERIVLHQGDTPVNGPHQGAWVDTPDGQDWFSAFSGCGKCRPYCASAAYALGGRLAVIGVNEKDGCGEPVLRYQKPDVGAVYPIDAPEDSDFFEGDTWDCSGSGMPTTKKSGTGWEMEGLPCLHSPLIQKHSFATSAICCSRNGRPRSFRSPHACIWSIWERAMWRAWCHWEGIITALLVKKEKGKLILQQRTGNWTKDDEVRTDLGQVEENTLYLRMRVEKETYVSFETGCDEEHFSAAGETVEASPGRWVGVKAGLAAINEGGSAPGSIKADYFVFEALH